MNLDLTKEEFLELLELATIGARVRNAVREAEGAYTIDDEQLELALYEAALEEGLIEVAEEMSGEDAIEAMRRQHEKAINDFVDDEFWHELEIRLAERDFERNMSEPIRAYRDHYAQELKTFGVDRIEINKDALVSDLRETL